mmetsp:Transcript_27058/g.56665  ORF Transcript_27058/g.56665 Transcript_27058/m.56665 type:complete len:290 (+) Transcript_27058:961-1830(+)
MGTFDDTERAARELDSQDLMLADEATVTFIKANQVNVWSTLHKCAEGEVTIRVSTTYGAAGGLKDSWSVVTEKWFPLAGQFVYDETRYWVRNSDYEASQFFSPRQGQLESFRENSVAVDELCVAKESLPCTQWYSRPGKVMFLVEGQGTTREVYPLPWDMQNAPEGVQVGEGDKQSHCPEVQTASCKQDEALFSIAIPALFNSEYKHPGWYLWNETQLVVSKRYNDIPAVSFVADQVCLPRSSCYSLRLDSYGFFPNSGDNYTAWLDGNELFTGDGLALSSTYYFGSCP